MLFSIITVVYNGADTIGPTIESVNAQSFRDFEHIVVDGLSKDGTCDLVRKLANPTNLLLQSEPDKGIYDAMNKGLRLASGDYVLYLNAGDRLHDAETLATVARLIKENNFPGVVYGQTDIVDAEGKRIASRHLTAPETLTADSFKNGMLVCHQAFYALRSITEPYNLDYRFSADFDWCIRVLKRSQSNVYAGCVLADYLSEGATTNNRMTSLRERAAIMAKYYGFFPTLLRHIGFALRALKRRFA